MEKSYESIYHSAEDTNWWFKARQYFVYAYLQKHRFPSSARILDIGCGGGGLLSYLNKRGYTEIAGLDLSPEAIAFCHSRGLENVHVDDAQTIQTFKNESFDCIIASDVLEHLPNDAQALSRWRELLKTGGILIIFVPAYQSLWSERDRVNNHFRRYTKSSLLSLTNTTSLKPLLTSYWNCCMLVPYTVLLKIKAYTSEKIVTIRKEETIVNKILKLLLTIENKLIIHGLSLPFGVSFLGIFKK